MLAINLQAVGDAVLNLLQQHFFFPQQLLHLLLDPPPVGHVLEGQQHGAVGTLLIENLAGVEQHDAAADAGKLAVDFVAFDGRLAA